MLLHEVRGPTSFEDLKTVNGILHPTFQSTCETLRLLEDDNYWDTTLEVAALCDSPLNMRELFTIMLTILCNIEKEIRKIFFLDSPSGTGKTFLINLLLAKVRSNRGITLAVASSGIAATLLEEGKTVHAAFKLPLNLIHVETPLCNISKQSSAAQVLRDCKLIVLDESTMAHKGGFEALNSTLKDIRGNDDMMVGVTMLLAGDFRQTLPIVPKGTRADEVKACIKASNLLL
ncbi:unnamed protein product [Parnassius mnemosyne]|uniref:ATP-dependent DNA helicase n=1 Tax=Parnassius mnemosyne TaxID=213953 RepID=A0AAV1L2A8_9NEOP